MISPSRLATAAPMLRFAIWQRNRRGETSLLSPPASSALRTGRSRLVLPVALFLLCGPTAAPAQTTEPGFSVDPFELEVVAIVNAERAALGLRPLLSDARLFQSAEDHTGWMHANGLLSHVGAGDSNAADRALAAGYRARDWGETISQGLRTPESVVRGRRCDAFCADDCDADGRCNGFKQSPSHWEVLMSAAFRDIGVGYVAGEATRHWWTIVVADSSGPTQPLQITPSPTPTSTPSVTMTPTRTPTRTFTPTPTTRQPRPTRTHTPIRTPTAARTATQRVAAPTATLAPATRTATRTSPTPSATVTAVGPGMPRTPRPPRPPRPPRTPVPRS